MTPSLFLKFIGKSILEEARFAPTTLQAFKLIVALTSIANFQLIVDLFLNPNCERACTDVASATICNKSIKLIDVLSSKRDFSVPANFGNTDSGKARALSTIFPTLHNRKSKYIVTSHFSKTFLHFRKDFVIFCEGDWENVNNENDSKEYEGQILNLPSSAKLVLASLASSALLTLVSLSFALLALVHICLVGRMDPISLVSLSGRISVNILASHNSLGGFVGQISLVGSIGLDGMIGLVGQTGLVGLAGQIASVGHVGLIGHTGLVNQNNLDNHIGLVGLSNLVDIIGLSSFFGLGLVSLAGLIDDISLISPSGISGLVSFIGLGISLIGLGRHNGDISLIGLDFVLSARWLIDFIGLGIKGLISLAGLSGINGLIGQIGLISLVGLSGFGLISLVGLGFTGLISHISLTGLIGDISFISLFGYVGLIGRISHNSLASITGLSLFHWSFKLKTHGVDEITNAAIRYYCAALLVLLSLIWRESGLWCEWRVYSSLAGLNSVFLNALQKCKTIISHQPSANDQILRHEGV
jgi:hypothetical protein